MKYKAVVPSSSPLTTIRVAGKDHHFFHSQALGKCRAILISPDENPPYREKSHLDMVNDEIDLYEQESSKKAEKTPSKGDYLELLMRCDSRLFLRFARFWENYHSARDNESKAYWLKRAEMVQRAMTRVSTKIGLLFVEGKP